MQQYDIIGTKAIQYLAGDIAYPAVSAIQRAAAEIDRIKAGLQKGGSQSGAHEPCRRSISQRADSEIAEYLLGGHYIFSDRRAGLENHPVAVVMGMVAHQMPAVQELFYQLRMSGRLFAGDKKRGLCPISLQQV